MKSANQSASSIEAFQACPMRYFLRYVQRIDPIEDTTALRMGTTWHKCLEILTMEPGGACPNKCGSSKYPVFCSLCDGCGRIPDDLRMSLIRHLNQAYENKPPSIEPEDWAVERVTLLNSALGWQWYWQDDAVETLAREVWFRRQVTLGRRVGVLDRLLRWKRRVMLGEYKSTSKSIDSNSVYWKHLRGNPQLSLYLIEAQQLQEEGELSKYGITAKDPLIKGVLFDVWHKPSIRPKKLTQAESKQFLQGEKCGEYHGQTFAIITHPPLEESPKTKKVYVDGVFTEIYPGKKDGTFAIRETPDMFGARLLSDIQRQPEKHFARREIARTDRELDEADVDFYNLARLTHFMTLRDLWYRNERQCTATYRCPYFTICHDDLLPAVRQGQIPDGFKRKGT